MPIAYQAGASGGRLIMFRVSMLAGAAAAAVTTSLAMAAYVVEDAPSWRGEDNTSYYNWEDFTSANGYAEGPNLPNNEPFPSGNALLFNFGDGAIISGGDNIYGYAGALNIHTYAYSESDITDVVFNFATLGTQIDFTGAMLAWTAANGEQGMIFPGMGYNLNYSEEFEFGPGQNGYSDNVSWSFDLSFIDADIREVGLIWNSVSSNISLDTATVDLRFSAIPAPGALALFGFAMLAGSRRRK